MPKRTSRNIFGNDTTPSLYIYIYISSFIYIQYIHMYIIIYLLYIYISLYIYFMYMYIYIYHYTSIVYIICQLSYGARNVLQSKKKTPNWWVANGHFRANIPTVSNPGRRNWRHVGFLANRPKLRGKLWVVFWSQKSSLKLTAIAPENGGPLEVWRFLLETIISKGFSL